MDELHRLARDIERIPDDIERKAERLVRASTLRLEALGKAFCPVLTGLLRASIDSDFDMTGRAKQGESGPHTSYDHYVHGGTSRQRPQPFMFQALAVVEPQFIAGAEAIGAGVLDVRVSRRG